MSLTAVALFGGSPMVRGQLAQLLGAQDIELVMDPDGVTPPGTVAIVAPEGEAEEALAARVRAVHGRGLPVVLLLREGDRELAGRGWPSAGVVLRPFRAPVLLATLRAIAAAGPSPAR